MLLKLSKKYEIGEIEQEEYVQKMSRYFRFKK